MKSRKRNLARLLLLNVSVGRGGGREGRREGRGEGGRLEWNFWWQRVEHFCGYVVASMCSSYMDVVVVVVLIVV